MSKIINALKKVIAEFDPIHVSRYKAECILQVINKYYVKRTELTEVREALIVMDFKYHIHHVTCRDRCCNEHCMSNAKLLWGDINPSHDDMEEWHSVLIKHDMNKIRATKKQEANNAQAT